MANEQGAGARASRQSIDSAAVTAAVRNVLLREFCIAIGPLGDPMRDAAAVG